VPPGLWSYIEAIVETAQRTGNPTDWSNSVSMRTSDPRPGRNSAAVPFRRRITTLGTTNSSSTECSKGTGRRVGSADGVYFGIYVLQMLDHRPRADPQLTGGLKVGHPCDYAGQHVGFTGSDRQDRRQRLGRQPLSAVLLLCASRSSRPKLDVSVAWPAPESAKMSSRQVESSLPSFPLVDEEPILALMAVGKSHWGPCASQD
jgi:hypothetical protein